MPQGTGGGESLMESLTAGVSQVNLVIDKRQWFFFYND